MLRPIPSRSLIIYIGIDFFILHFVATDLPLKSLRLARNVKCRMLFHIVLLSFKRYYKHTGNEKEINFIYTFKHLLSCYATKFPFMYQIMPSARYKFVLQIDGYTQRLIQKKLIGLQMIKILLWIRHTFVLILRAHYTFCSYFHYKKLSR